MVEESRGTSVTRESKVTKKRISRWLLFKLVFKVGLYILLVLAGWSGIIWGSFLIAFSLGLIVSGISLFFIAYALNHGIEDGITRSAEIYADSVFPAGGKFEGTDVSLDLGMPLMEATAKRDFAKGDAVHTRDIDPLIEHETTENGSGGMVFEFEEADAVQLDTVDQEIEDILKGE